MRTGKLAHQVQRAGRRVEGRRAGDPERIDVAARERRQAYRSAQVLAPQDGAGCRIDGVDAVVLRRDDDLLVNDKRLGIDGAVELGSPGLR
jgi:hypothetical protein